MVFHTGQNRPYSCTASTRSTPAAAGSTLGVLWAVLRCYSDGEMRVTRVLWDYNIAR